MINIHTKTLQDLEFDTVLNQTSDYCITLLGKEAVLSIQPFKSKEELLVALALVNEYISSFENDNKIPNHGFEDITEALKLLQIENTFLEVPALRKIAALSENSNILIKFFQKFEEYYPTLYKKSSQVAYTTAIVDQIKSIINRFGEVKNEATPALQSIRKAINSPTAL